MLGELVHRGRLPTQDRVTEDHEVDQAALVDTALLRYAEPGLRHGHQPSATPSVHDVERHGQVEAETRSPVRWRNTPGERHVDGAVVIHRQAAKLSRRPAAERRLRRAQQGSCVRPQRHRVGGVGGDMHPAEDLAEARPRERAAGDPECCGVTRAERAMAGRSHRRKRSGTVIHPARVIHSPGVRGSAGSSAARRCATPNSAPAAAQPAGGPPRTRLRRLPW